MARRRAGRVIAAHVHGLAPEQRRQARAHEAPRALVGRLLLHPADVLRVRVARDHRPQGGLGERIELLDAHDRRVVAITARLVEAIEDLARDQQQPSRARTTARVVEHGAERAVTQLGQRRERRCVAQQALGRLHHERLAEAPAHLAAQGVEELRRGRRHDHLHVALGAELQEALGARAGVLGALPLVAVGQQQHEATLPLPLELAGGDELVDHHLRAVGEVAELRLPHHQPARIAARHAVLEAQHARFAERTVDGLHPRLVLRQVIERHPRAAVGGVEDGGVAMAERAAHGVLSGKAHARAFDEQ